MFWPDLAEDFDSIDKYTILFGDLDRDEIIVDTNKHQRGDSWPVGVVPERVEYDENDRFDVQGPHDLEPRAVRNIEVFERALAQFLAVSPDSDEGTGACLEWENFRRERDTAVIRLWRLGEGQTC